MISIIVCSINPTRCNKLLNNISETIGIEYETIVFDNRNKKWSICKVYNNCAERARFPFLCFIHEDVYIDTKSWGKKIIEIIEKIPNCGLIGFAGGIQARKNFCSWWTSETRVNIHDGFNGKNHPCLKENYNWYYYSNPNSEDYSRVLCIDGLFQFIKKKIWEEIKYDEYIFSGFHFYDVDFSFAVAEKYNNYIIFGIDTFHDSHGYINSEYLNNMFLFQNKWKNKLPKDISNNDILKTKEKLKNIISELKDAFTIFILCKNEHFDLKKYFLQIYKINGLLFLVILLFFIPINVIIKIIYRII